MARGYNVAQLADGTVVASVVQLSADTDFSLRFADGHVDVRTLSIHPDDQPAGAPHE
jgi:exonuclease VII large subunit